jgi:hypothetical protein
MMMMVLLLLFFPFLVQCWCGVVAINLVDPMTLILFVAVAAVVVAVGMFADCARPLTQIDVRIVLLWLLCFIIEMLLLLLTCSFL